MLYTDGSSGNTGSGRKDLNHYCNSVCLHCLALKIKNMCMTLDVLEKRSGKERGVYKEKSADLEKSILD